jgi:hypothetical protein
MIEFLSEGIYHSRKEHSTQSGQGTV